MNTSIAKKTLNIISSAFFNGRNYNDTLFYETPFETPEGGLTGIVSEIVRRGEIKVLGDFVIDVDGKIKNFPGLPQDIIEGINRDNVTDCKQESVEPPVKDKATEVKTKPDMDVDRKGMGDKPATEPQVEKKPKKRGRPSKKG